MSWGEKNRKINNRVGGTIIRDSRVIEKEKKNFTALFMDGVQLPQG